MLVPGAAGGRAARRTGGGREFFSIRRRSPLRDEDYYFALILPIEGDRFLLTLASWGGRVFPADHESFAALCARLRSPIVAEALAISKPISRDLPSQGDAEYLEVITRSCADPRDSSAIADAVCAFNPVYAQGMTSASVCSQILGKADNRDGSDRREFPGRF